MKVLELFAGSRSFGKVAEIMGFKVLSVDKFITKDMDIVCGVEDLEREQVIDLLGVPDIIWASPVCSAWTKTGWFHYWDTEHYKGTGKFKPKKEFANESIQMIKRTIEIFSWFPDADFYMENPEGLLAKHPVINSFLDIGLHKGLKRRKVTYCSYGSLVRKPTHIWTNSKWVPRPHCNEGDSCHLRTPKGSRKGTRSLKNGYERSKVPEQLCFEILSQYSIEYSINPGQAGQFMIF